MQQWYIYENMTMKNTCHIHTNRGSITTGMWTAEVE